MKTVKAKISLKLKYGGGHKPIDAPDSIEGEIEIPLEALGLAIANAPLPPYDGSLMPRLTEPGKLPVDWADGKTQDEVQEAYPLEVCKWTGLKKGEQVFCDYGQSKDACVTILGINENGNALIRFDEDFHPVFGATIRKDEVRLMPTGNMSSVSE